MIVCDNCGQQKMYYMDELKIDGRGTKEIFSIPLKTYLTKKNKLASTFGKDICGICIIKTLNYITKVLLERHNGPSN